MAFHPDLFSSSSALLLMIMLDLALALSLQPVPKRIQLSLWGPLASLEHVGKVWRF